MCISFLFFFSLTKKNIRDNINALQSTGRVNGLIVLLREAMDQNDFQNLRSPEGNCPNCQFGLYADDADSYNWNPQVTVLCFFSS